MSTSGCFKLADVSSNLLEMWNVSRSVLNEDVSNKFFETATSRNVLDEFNGSCTGLGKVLFLSCRDLRNPLCCIERTFTFEQLELHLNNESTTVTARNVLIATILSKLEKESITEEDLLYVWDVWYNAFWKKSHIERFVKDLRELVDGNLPDNVKIPDDQNFASMKKMWNKWLSVSSSTDHELFKNSYLEKRSDFVENHWNAVHNKGQPKIPLDQVIEILTQQMENSIFNHNQSHPGGPANPELSHFYKTGACQITESADYVNPTFKSFRGSHWKVDYACPFECYAPLQCRSDQSLVNQCLDKLKKLIYNFLSYKHQIVFHFHLSAAVQLCLDSQIPHFNVIYCFDLADEIGLANLLVAATRKLEHSQDAVLITDSAKWSTLSPSIVQYIETALCTPLTLLPTHFGLQLINHVQLGHEVPFDIVNMSTMPVSLRWRRAEPFINVYPVPSLSTRQMIDHLKNWCFYLPEHSLASGEQCGMKHYTPLTMGHVILSLIHRLNWTREDVEKLLPSKLDVKFDLSINLLKSWLKTASFTRLFIKTPVSETLREELCSWKTTFLRIVINHPHSETKYYLDNFLFTSHQDTEEDYGTVSLTLFLPKDHQLQPESTVTLTYIESSTHFYVGTLKEFIEEKNECDPLITEAFLSGSAISSDLPMNQFTETEDQYEVDLIVQQENLESADPVVKFEEASPRCECSHRAEIRFLESVSIISFPWPVEIGNPKIVSVEESGQHMQRLTFKKSLNEPWPDEWLNSIKWNLEQLETWESLHTREDLSIHLSSQFYFRDLQENLTGTENAVLPTEPSASLREVRCTIQSLFVRSLIDGHSYFAVRDNRQPNQSPDWYLRIHLPVRISPFGCPILSMSGYDQRMARKLHEQGRKDIQTSIEEMKRVLDIQPSTEVVTVLTYTDEEANLLRYILRLNSTKILPTSWQRENFALREDGPWLATFVSPLYIDHPGNYPDMKDFIGAVQSVSDDLSTSETTGGLPIENKKSCATCKKEETEMKRCGRCKVIFYCSVQCQRNDWPNHKLICST